MKTLDEVLLRTQKVFKSVFGDDIIEVSLETTAKDIPDWDSINHIQLMVNIEEHFGIEFSASEIRNFANVGELCKSVLSKLGS